jgi:hypothetical protein
LGGSFIKGVSGSTRRPIKVWPSWVDRHALTVAIMP